MRKWSILIFPVYLLMACSNRDAAPKGVLSKKEMQEVLWDLSRTGEFLNGFVFSNDTGVNRADVSRQWYDKVFELHNISPDEFYKSYTYYQKHPILLKEVLDSISRKPPVAADYGEPAVFPSADSGGKKPVLPSIDTRIKPFDSIKKRRILKK